MAATVDIIEASRRLPLVPVSDGLAVKEAINMASIANALRKLDSRDKVTKVISTSQPANPLVEKELAAPYDILSVCACDTKDTWCTQSSVL